MEPLYFTGRRFSWQTEMIAFVSVYNITVCVQCVLYRAEHDQGLETETEPHAVNCGWDNAIISQHGPQTSITTDRNPFSLSPPSSNIYSQPPRIVNLITSPSRWHPRLQYLRTGEQVVCWWTTQTLARFQAIMKPSYIRIYKEIIVYCIYMCTKFIFVAINLLNPPSFSKDIPLVQQ